MATKKQEWIVVDAETIAGASRSDSSHCMIADAIKNAFPHLSGISVDLQSIRFTDRAMGKRFVYFTPDICQIQLLRFDQGVVVEPWAFRLPARPAQVTPITARKNRPNLLGRPLSEGPKQITQQAKNYVPTIVGGKTPPPAVLAHSPAAGRHVGKRRIFGMKMAGEFQPGPGKIDITV